MTKRFLSPVRRNNGYMRQQQLQTLALIFIIILLALKIYIQMVPRSLDAITPCENCNKLHENQSQEQTDNELMPEIDDVYSSIDSSEETDVEVIQPAFHSLPPSDIKYEFTVVTGASKNHFCPIKSFIYHTNHTLRGINARVIVYDLGFSNSQRRELLKLRALGYFTELRSFQWSHYPSFWNITLSRGEYAWKPAMVAEVARDYPGKLVWLDSGTLAERKFFKNLNPLLKKYKGFVSPRSSGTMKTWTHPGVYDYYDDDHKKYDHVKNCNGASVVFDTKITKNLIDEWFKCALVKDCIAPPGSSRANHRQDQAILTYLATKNNLRCNANWLKIGIRTHEDGHCKKHIAEYATKHNDYI